MKKVITINLNGKAYQLDEDAYDALVAYLDRAAAHLKDNPDLTEIMADLEQAIADKCQRYLGVHKTVVAAAEVAQILEEMGPVATPAEGGARPADAGSNAREQPKGEAGQPQKRLYQLHENAMLSGVCAGIAAYLGIDVSIVRIVFVLLAIVTKGVWILVYVILMFVIPYADTSEERAAAYGRPFSAKDLVEQAKRQYSDFADRHASRRAWRQQWRQQRREWRERMRGAMYGPSRWWTENVEHPPYAMQVLAGILVPILSVLSAAFFFVLLWSIISLGTRGEVFGWPMPPGLPLWAALLGIFIIYQLVVTPLVIGRYVVLRSYERYHYGWLAFWGGLMRFGFIVLFFWLAYIYMPEFRDFVNGLPDLIREWTRTL